jgi:hypothetical protein
MTNNCYLDCCALQSLREKEAKSHAVVLEMIGDLPDADMAPPENVLFVCKLNPVTTDDDLEIIFTRFGPCKAEICRDHITGELSTINTSALLLAVVAITAVTAAVSCAVHLFWVQGCCWRRCISQKVFCCNLHKGQQAALSCRVLTHTPELLLFFYTQATA